MRKTQNEHLTLYRQELRTILGRDDLSEELVHQFLVATPILLPLIWPRYNRVFSKLPLGNQHVTDFAFARRTTPGVQWYLVELEHPNHRLFNNDGNPSAKLTHGLRQLNDWESWYRQNIAYVKESFPLRESMKTCGLYPEPELILVIGRRESLSDDQRERLRTMTKANQEIMTYDRLLEETGSGCFPQFTVDCCSFAAGTTKKLGSVMPVSDSFPCSEEM